MPSDRIPIRPEDGVDVHDKVNDPVVAWLRSKRFTVPNPLPNNSTIYKLLEQRRLESCSGSTLCPAA